MMIKMPSIFHTDSTLTCQCPKQLRRYAEPEISQVSTFESDHAFVFDFVDLPSVIIPLDISYPSHDWQYAA